MTFEKHERIHFGQSRPITGVSINTSSKNRYIAMAKHLYKAIGEPEYCDLFWDASGRRVGIAAGTDYKVSGQRQVYPTRFIDDHGLTQGRYDAEVDDGGMIVFGVDS